MYQKKKNPAKNEVSFVTVKCCEVSGIILDELQILKLETNIYMIVDHYSGCKMATSQIGILSKCSYFINDFYLDTKHQVSLICNANKDIYDANLMPK